MTFQNDTITFYNNDESVYQKNLLPAGYAYYDYISDKLFNSDTLLEFLAYKAYTNTSTFVTTETFSVINELGQIMYTFPDTNLSGIKLFHYLEYFFQLQY